MPCFPSSRRRSLAGPDRSPWWLFPAAAGLALAVLAGLPASAQVSFGTNRLLTISAGGTPAQNCAGLRSTIAGITDAVPSQPYVLRLEPGLYNCGSSSLVLKPNVYLEGGGAQETRIFGSVDDAASGAVHLVNSSALRHLLVYNYSDGDSIAVSVGMFGPCTSHDFSGCGPSEIRNIVAFADGRGSTVGLQVDTSQPLTVLESHLNGLSAAFKGFDSEVQIERTLLIGGVIVFGSDPVTISYSRLIGTVAGLGLRCVYSYDATTLGPRSATCT